MKMVYDAERQKQNDGRPSQQRSSHGIINSVPAEDNGRRHHHPCIAKHGRARTSTDEHSQSWRKPRPKQGLDDAFQKAGGGSCRKWM
jgi:hypothetical protein